MQSWQRFCPDTNKTFIAHFASLGGVKGGFSAHMIAMEASDDMCPIADAKRVGQGAQLAVRDTAFDAVAVILE